MSQYRYFGSGAHMSADLKITQHRVRTNRPRMFASSEIRESTMDGEGKVNVTLRKDVKAIAMTPKRRHEFATKRV